MKISSYLHQILLHQYPLYLFYPTILEKEEMINNGEIREKKDIEKERSNREERE